MSEDNDKKEKPELKEVYAEIMKKHDLPDYDKLVEDFDIDRCDSEDEYLIRSIRRVIGEKVNAYLHFFEVLVNPSSPPVYIYSFLKNLKAKHKQTIKDIYAVLSRNQVKLMKLDTVYDEKEEAEFVSKFFKDWQVFKKDIYTIMQAIDDSFDSNASAKGRSYLG